MTVKNFNLHFDNGVYTPIFFWLFLLALVFLIDVILRYRKYRRDNPPVTILPPSSPVPTNTATPSSPPVVSPVNLDVERRRLGDCVLRISPAARNNWIAEQEAEHILSNLEPDGANILLEELKIQYQSKK